MTNEEFLALPNRERDALVAEKVMGFEVYNSPQYPTISYVLHHPNPNAFISLGFRKFQPTTSIADAWEVADKCNLSVVRTKDWGNEVEGFLAAEFGSGWYEYDWDGPIKHAEWAPTAPLAISLAALRTVGALDPTP